MDIISTFLNVLLIILGFGMLIFVHELGHFLAAKWAGIRTDGFAIGMGTPVVSWRKGVGMCWGSTTPRVIKRAGRQPIELTDAELQQYGVGETEYSLRWLPIGGFVKMLGQDDIRPAAEIDDPRSYTKCPIGKRMVVISAGVIMNLIAAMVMFIAAFLVGVRFEAAVVGSVAVTSPAGTTTADNADALGLTLPGLLPGDRIVEIDGDPVTTFGDVQIASAMSHPDVPIRVLVQRPGVDDLVVFSLTPRKDASNGLLSVGLAPALSTTLFTSDRVLGLDEALAASGLGARGVEPGMRLLSVNGDSISTIGQVNVIAATSTGGPLRTEWAHVDADGEATASIVDAPVDVRPVFPRMFRPPLGAGKPVEYDVGLFGLTPLTKILDVVPDSHNADVLQADDLVLQIGSISSPTISQLRQVVQANPGRTVGVRVLREGEAMDLTLTVNRQGAIGVYPGPALDVPRLANLVTEALPDATTPDATPLPTPAAGLDIMPYSAVTDVAGTPVTDWASMRAAMLDVTSSAFASGGGATVSLTVVPPLAEAPPEEVTLSLDAADVAMLHGLGWEPDLNLAMFEPEYTIRRASNPIRAVVMGFEETHKLMMLTYLTLDRLVRGTVGVEQLRGPVGIVHIGTRVADQGFMYLVFFLAMISVNLAVINFLPLPIVDGGLFLFLIYEKFKGRPPSVGFQNATTLIGVALIATLFLYITYNDIMRLIS